MDRKSLRKKRPSGISRSGDGKSQSNTNDPNDDLPPARPRPNAKPVNPQMRKSRVDDKIKKRMSMRYNDGGGTGDLRSSAYRGAPDVPALPGSGGGRGSTRVLSEREMVREDPRAVDIDILQQDGFDPDAYLRLKLHNSTEAELKTLQVSLVASKTAAATDLQYSIFKNYEEFILISKEISTLENDMLELKESLSEWKSMPALLRIEDGSQAQDRRKVQRSSVADLRVLYASQMAELHSKIEGSAKFVPALPGRHVISQSPELYHLNPATYKVEYAVVLVLLDDSVLVAKRRRRRNGERGGLVADKCWALGEVVLVDVKDTADRTNILKLRHGRETHVFRTERSAEKKSLLASFRRAAEELSTRKRKAREGEHERRMSVWSMGGAGAGDRLSMGDVPPLPEWAAEARGLSGLNTFGALGGLGGGPGAKDKAEGDARWISEFSDGLTVAIALREWEEAVGLVEEGQRHLSTKPALRDRLTHLTTSLISALIHALTTYSQRKNTIVTLSSYLARLNATPAARAAFLSARRDVIRKRIRMIPLEGDIKLYVFDLAVIVFTGVKHTAEWYLAAFKDNESTAHFVQWSREQVENYCVMYKKQLDSTDDPRIISDCYDITKAQNKRLLLENGLDFSFLLSDLLGLRNGSVTGASSSMTTGTRSTLGASRPTTPRSPSDPATRSRPVPPRSMNRPPSTSGSGSASGTGSYR